MTFAVLRIDHAVINGRDVDTPGRDRQLPGRPDPAG